MNMCQGVYLILVCDTRRQPSKTRDPFTWTSRTAKKARANEATRERLWRVFPSTFSISRCFLGSLDESEQPA